MQAELPQSKRPRVQFSLSLLLAMSLITAAIIHWIFTERELRSVKAENERLRIELGTKLEIKNPALIYVRSRQQADVVLRRWRIYLPPGYPQRLRLSKPGTIVSDNDRPPKNPGQSILLPIGEFDLDLILDYNRKYQPAVRIQQPEHPEEIHLINDIGPEVFDLMSTLYYGGEHQTIPYRPNSTVPIMVLRHGRVVNRSPEQPPSAGVLIWIESSESDAK